MKYFGISDIGLVRHTNQDCYSITTNSADDTLAIVCDGIGGGQSGDVASQTVAHYFSECFIKQKKFTEDKEIKEWLITTVKEINHFVVDLAKTKSIYNGMGTTLVAALCCDIGTYVLNVGDSRAYILVDEELTCVTKDHTLVENLVNRGIISEADAFNHPQRHVLTNAMGIEENIKIDIFPLKTKYDFLLLCSDGLHGFSTDEEIKEVLLSDKDEVKLSQKLVNYANKKGGFDNITVVLLKGQA